MTVISRSPKTAFIQASKYDGGWGHHPHLSSSCMAAAQALKALGYDVRTFTPGKLPARHRVTPDTPVKGDTACVKYLYERTFGVEYPNFDVPKPLKRFARRTITQSTLGELRAQHRVRPFRYNEKFVKPSVQAKLFRGQDASYVTSYTYTTLSNLPDSTPISVQDYRNFQDETRFFVSPWTGPLTVEGHTDYLDQDELRTFKKLQEFANTIYETWKPTGPKCYVMDVGMSSKPLTNHGYSIPAERKYPTLVEINSVLTAGNLDEVKPNSKHPGRLVATGWKSYARYAERGEF
mgnify:FL=1